LFWRFIHFFLLFFQEQNMNLMDLFIIAGLIWFVYKGAQVGLAKELVGLTGWLIAAVIALKFGGRAGNMAAAYLPQIGLLSTTLVGFLIVLVGMHLFFRIFGYMLNKMLGGDGQGSLDRLGGGLIGFIKGAFIISILALAISSLNLGSRAEGYQQSSSLFPHMAKFAQLVVDQVVRVAPAVAEPEAEPEAADGEPPGR
jgi:membrane protein required for colicin V production